MTVLLPPPTLCTLAPGAGRRSSVEVQELSRTPACSSSMNNSSVAPSRIFSQPRFSGILDPTLPRSTSVLQEEVPFYCIKATEIVKAEPLAVSTQLTSWDRKTGCYEQSSSSDS